MDEIAATEIKQDILDGEGEYTQVKEEVEEEYTEFKEDVEHNHKNGGGGWERIPSKLRRKLHKLVKLKKKRRS